eukprot:10882663-Prorocentrum_lima.AAC.1
MTPGLWQLMCIAAAKQVFLWSRCTCIVVWDRSPTTLSCWKPWPISFLHGHTHGHRGTTLRTDFEA